MINNRLKIRVLSLFFLAALSISNYAQDDKSKLDKQDKKAYKIEGKADRKFVEQDFDKAMKLYESALKEAKTADFTALLHLKTARLYLTLLDYTQSIPHYEAAMQADESLFTSVDVCNYLDALRYTGEKSIRPILVDKMLDFEQDLLTDNIYHFKQRKVSEEQKYIDTDRFLLKLYGNNEVIDNEDSSVQITYVKSVLKIESSEMIKDILVYDLYGRLVFNKTAIGSTLYSQTVSLSPSTYIVKVQLDNNKTKASKIVAL